MKAKKVMTVVGAGAGLAVAVAAYMMNRKKRQSVANDSETAHRKHSHIRKSH